RGPPRQPLRAGCRTACRGQKWFAVTASSGVLVGPGGCRAYAGANYVCFATIPPARETPPRPAGNDPPRRGGCCHPFPRNRAPPTPWTTTQDRRPAPPVSAPRPPLTCPGNPADAGVPGRTGAHCLQRVLRAVGNVGGHLPQVAPEA